MKVKVHYLGYIKNMLEKKDEEFDVRDGAKLLELLDKLAGLYGQPFKKEVFEHGLKDLKYGFVITVNGVLMGQLNGIETRLKEGDNIILMSLMSGG
jgi:MoaD family protein